MEIKIGKKTVELKYTYNSFRMIEDFDFSTLEELEHKPFKMLGAIEELLYGAMNHDPKNKFTKDTVVGYIEEYMVDDSPATLLEQLTKLLEESSFFKSLQKNQIEK